MTTPISDDIDILARPFVRFKARDKNGNITEDAITIALANALRTYSKSGNLKAVWHHPCNEAKVPPHVGAKRKAMGLIPGTADFVFSWANGSGYIEIKKQSGTVQPTQKAFRKWCEKHGVKYAVCRSDVDALATLREWGVLK